ncbi:hypothetical protein K435DRAFT_576835, partial [Dendrothele bispora CBS 962.96]
KWHRIFGHLNMGSLKLLKEKGMVDGLFVDESTPSKVQCIPCIQAKSHVKPFPKEAKRHFTKPGQMTYSDVWGPAQTTGINGEKYAVTFTDAYS